MVWVGSTVGGLLNSWVQGLGSNLFLVVEDIEGVL